MRIAVTNPREYIGRALVKAGALPLACDVTNISEVKREIALSKATHVVHHMKVSSVEYCENEMNFNEAYRANIFGTTGVAAALSDAGISGVLVVSHHIWRGGYFEQHTETSKMTEPVNRLGMMMVAAETIAKDYGMNVVRTSSLFDSEKLQGKIEMLKSGDTITEPTFMERSFMHVDHFAYALKKYCTSFYNMPRILNIAGSAPVSWNKFMRDVAKEFGLDERLVAKRFFENKKFSPRPRNGSLDIHAMKSLKLPLFSYFDGIERMVKSED